MSIFDWLNVGGQVIDLASNIASLFGEADDPESATPYDLGALSFGADSSQQTWVGNPNTQDMQLTMCQVQQQQGTVQPGTVSTPILVPANAGVNITQAMQLYQSGGSFIITPTASPSQTLTQAISFAIKSLSIGATISIVNGVSGNFGRNADGTWSFSVRSTGPQLTGGTVTVVDQNNMTVTAQVAFNPSGGLGEDDGTAILPSALSLAPTITNVAIELQMSPSHARQLFFNDSVPLDQIPVFRNLKRA